MTDTLEDGVVVVGAGAAGLSAAAHLRAQGVTVTLLEAGPCIGGRARTVRLAALNGELLDLGAAWLHAADSNPLVALATPEDGLVNSDVLGTGRLFIAGREATAAEQAEYEACWDAVERLQPGAADTSLAALMASVPGPWAPTIALWEGAIIAAADADDLSAEDWRRNLLPPPNLLPPGGLGDFVARRLATPAWLDTPATRIAWDGPGVRVDTPRGTVRAAACVVTVST
ncbi:MAG: FAD-dependent oxidoreductase, partial [Janthinobacterium lividum]